MKQKKEEYDLMEAFFIGLIALCLFPITIIAVIGALLKKVFVK